MSSDGNALTGLWFDGQNHFGDTRRSESVVCDLPVFRQTAEWLAVYFSSRAPDFIPPLCLLTTPFRRTVCEIMLTIPFGQTMTYGEIAAIIAKQRNVPHMSAQAVGGAVGHNPISLIIPCHRVIGSDGSLTGYAAGLDRKAALLKLEQIL